ncbi:hypothetical protein HDZ31DRAFT_30127 [Schizophyllum fasciatum]
MVDSAQLTAHYHASSVTPPSQSTILRSATKMICHATTVNQWKTVFIPNGCNTSRTGCKLLLCPPVIAGQKRRPELRDWGAPVNSSLDDVFDMHDLLDFESSDFGCLRQTLAKRKAEDTDPCTPGLKKRKLDVTPLYSLLPKPHAYLSPVSAKVKIAGLRPYAKTEPIVLDSEGSSRLVFSRNAWIVPVRGKLTWDACSSAALLEDPGRSDASIVPSPPKPKDNRILWTRDALQQFWNFLIYLRHKGRLGPIGLSYQVAPVGDHVSGPADFQNSLSRSYDTTSIDLIKIHHDGELSMYLRNILHLWACREDDGDTSIRVLRGARLLLANHTGKAFLIS